MSYQYELDWELEDDDGNIINCTIGIINFYQVNGSFDFYEACADDYLGYTELEFDVLNIYNEPSKELKALVSLEDRRKIETAMIAIVKEQNEGY